MNLPTGKWKLVSRADDSSSAVEYDGAASFRAAVQVAHDLGATINWQEEQQKLYLKPGKAKPAAIPKTAAADIPTELPVRYYYQFDSTSGEGHRMCNSSTNAMVVKYEKPNALSDSYNADDEYLARVKRYGDTTDHGAQLKALAFFGIHPQWRKDLTWADVDSQLRKRKPVPIAIYHKGPASAPYGGHCLLVIGKVGNSYRVHDPAGELDLINGGYGLGGSGKGVVYSKANLDRRWRVGGEAWGYLL